MGYDFTIATVELNHDAGTFKIVERLSSWGISGNWTDMKFNAYDHIDGRSSLEIIRGVCSAIEDMKDVKVGTPPPRSGDQNWYFGVRDARSTEEQADSRRLHRPDDFQRLPEAERLSIYKYLLCHLLEHASKFPLAYFINMYDQVPPQIYVDGERYLLEDVCELCWSCDRIH